MAYVAGYDTRGLSTGEHCPGPGSSTETPGVRSKCALNVSERQPALERVGADKTPALAPSRRNLVKPQVIVADALKGHRLLLNRERLSEHILLTISRDPKRRSCIVKSAYYFGDLVVRHPSPGALQ